MINQLRKLFKNYIISDSRDFYAIINDRKVIYLYKNDKYHGKYVIYNDNGTIKVIGNYINGKRERLWKEYNNKGDLIREGIYKNGILNK